MIVNNINPVLFNVGMFEVRYYGIIYALGFILAYFFLRYFIKKGKLNLESKKVDDYIMYLVLGVVLGARFFNFVFYSPSTFFTDPIELFRVWNGGLSFHGGLIGAVVGAYLFSKKNKIRMMELFDATSVPAILGLALGRIANFTNQELVGFVSNMPWCVVFNSVDSLCRHPYQLYASLSHFLLFGILIYIYLKSKKLGTTFWTFVMLYGGMRVLTDIFRLEVKWFLGLSTGQVLSLIMFIVGLVVLIKKKKD